MTAQVPCFILHRRPFRETSLIIEVVAQGYGRLNLVLKGAQGSKKSATSGLSQVFNPLLLSFSGAGELKTALSLESNGPAVILEDKFLYSGFYINEIICRLWPQNVDSDELFELYTTLLEDLSQTQQLPEPNAHFLEMLLRRFEFNLLRMLGFGIDCRYTAGGNELIEAGQAYRFIAEEGFVLSHKSYSGQPLFSGEDIVAIGQMNLTSGNVLKAAKHLARAALAPHLGGKPLKSRELFVNL
ncbi:MAG: DNA repair protein RecO [Algicola sp.]|nr:DNA repair protein RecO [Algicola sp.]